MHLHFFFQILSGIFVGWLAGMVVQGKGLGLLPNLLVGGLGAILGAFLANLFHIQMKGFWDALGVAVGGAVILLIILRMIKSD